MRALTSSLFVLLLLGSVATSAYSSAAARDVSTRAVEPKQAAQALYKAWRTKSRKAALAIATKDAVDKLFSVKWRAMHFKGCERRDEGGWQCIYIDRSLDLSLAMDVDGGASLGGYNVTAVSFSSEE